MKIAFACDHAGSGLKTTLLEAAVEAGHDCVNLGVDDRQSVDYPAMADRLIHAMADPDQSIERGVLVCGSGIGISIAANRAPHIRCALVHDATGARLCREHNDANVIALGERMIGTAVALECLNVFLQTAFEGGRHQRRVDMMSNVTR